MKKASGVVAKINFGWWIEKFNWILLGAVSLVAVSLLIYRSVVDPVLPIQTLYWLLGCVFVLAALVSWVWSRSSFIDRDSALVRLDDALSLENRLTSASRGIGRWPSIPSDLSDEGITWRWPSVFLPSLMCLGFLALAVFLPIQKREVGPKPEPVEPGAWERMEEWLATLEEQELIEELSIQELEEKIEELRDQPEEEWFSHSSLEATDTLEENLGKEIRNLANEMQSLERSMDALQKYRNELTEESRERLMQEYDEALKALQNSGMQMNEELLKQLGGIDPSQLGQASLSGMSEEQLKQLQKQLGECAGALGSMEGLPGMSEDPSIQEMAIERTPGRGGVERGRGDAPLYYGDKENLETNRIEGVKNDDFSRAAPGELVGVGETEWDVDETAAGPVAGGEIGSTGGGGKAVTRDVLLPDEQAVLKRYFK